MLTLLSTNEAAQKLGISIQGVHYRIKTNKLKSTIKDGKTFVYVELDDNTKAENDSYEREIRNKNLSNEIIKVKDEQITLLKRAIKWMGFSHKNEIKRLEQNHNKLIDVFKSEVELLQKAYNEMQHLYKIQYSTLENHQNNQNNLHQNNPVDKTIEIEEFFLMMKKYNKTNTQIKNIILDGLKSGDERFLYNKATRKFTIFKSNFQDLI